MPEDLKVFHASSLSMISPGFLVSSSTTSVDEDPFELPSNSIPNLAKIGPSLKALQSRLQQWHLLQGGIKLKQKWWK